MMKATPAAGNEETAVALPAFCPGIAPAPGGALAIDVSDLQFGYRKRSPVLQSIFLQVPPGRLVMVLGASGSGKTTLLKLIKGLLRVQEGKIRLFGTPLRPPGSRGRLDCRVAYIPQQLGLVRSRTVLDNALAGSLGQVASWRGMTGIFPRETVRLASQTLEVLGVGHKANERVRALSGGERQRVAIARALVQRPRILLADEFVSQLDPATTVDIMRLVQDIAHAGMTVLMTTHELDVVDRFAEWVVVLRDGEKAVDSPATAVRTAELSAVMRR